ncbi:MAG TPA: hypothetical protein DIC51_03385 [Coxiellaceae bacterium]|nr:hypothetical protein [Coxiellaceae bacterium]
METQLKHRLLGAIIILALLVIFVPMLFTRHQDNQLTVSENIPAPPAQPNVQTASPTLASQESQVENMLNTDQQQNQPTAQPQSITQPTPGMVQPQPAQPVSGALPEAPVSTAQPTSIAVTPAADQNTSDGLTAATPVIASNSATAVSSLPPLAATPTVNPVNAVPLSTDNTAVPTPLAQSEQTQLTHTVSKKSYQLSANKKLIAAKKTENSGVHASSAAVIKKQQKALATAKKYNQGWVVQLGNFTESKNAENMVRQLKAKGFKAFTYMSPKNKTYHVYVGPETKKESAEASMHKIESMMNTKAFVTTFDPTATH